LNKVHFVIPSRVESPVRNLLFTALTTDSLPDRTAHQDDSFSKLTH